MAQQHRNKSLESFVFHRFQSSRRRENAFSKIILEIHQIQQVRTDRIKIIKRKAINVAQIRTQIIMKLHRIQ